MLLLTIVVVDVTKDGGVVFGDNEGYSVGINI